MGAPRRQSFDYTGLQGSTASNGKCEGEGGSSPRRGFLQPDAASVLFHYALADCQADSAAGIFIACMQPLKKIEDLICVLGIDSNAIVGHGKYGPAVLPGGRDLYAGSLFI